MRVQVPVATTRVFTLPDAVTYDAVVAWLNAGQDHLAGRGVVTWVGKADEFQITVTGAVEETDFDTDNPILPL